MATITFGPAPAFGQPTPAACSHFGAPATPARGQSNSPAKVHQDTFTIAPGNTFSIPFGAPAPAPAAAHNPFANFGTPAPAAAAAANPFGNFGAPVAPAQVSVHSAFSFGFGAPSPPPPSAFFFGTTPARHARPFGCPQPVPGCPLPIREPDSLFGELGNSGAVEENTHVEQMDFHDELKDPLTKNITQTWDSELPLVQHGPMTFNYALKSVEASSTEFINIRKEFKKGFPEANLTAVWRVQNKRLLRAFRQHHINLAEAMALDGACKPKMYVAFHGARKAQALHSILQEGYDIVYASDGVNAYGHGVYHAKKAKTSHGYTCRTPKEFRPNGSASSRETRTMLLNIITVGESVRGCSRQIKPPVCPTSKRGRRYDTFVNGSSWNDSNIFVTTDNSQVYPAYVLSYSSAGYDQ